MLGKVIKLAFHFAEKLKIMFHVDRMTKLLPDGIWFDIVLCVNIEHDPWYSAENTARATSNISADGGIVEHRSLDKTKL